MNRSNELYPAKTHRIQWAAEWPYALAIAAVCILFFFRSSYFQLPIDDSFIAYRYAENLAEGMGFVFNQGERIEGFTCLLWILVLSLCHLFGGHVPACAPILGQLLGAATIVVSYLTLRGPLKVPPLTALIAPLLLATSPAFATWSSSGMETPLFAFLVVVSIDRLLREAQNPSLTVWSGWLFALSGLTRPEGFAVFGVFWFALLISGRFHRRLLWPFIQVFIAGISVTIFRLVYFGYPLPNTFYIKTGEGVAAWQEGWEYVKAFSEFHLVSIVLLVVTAIVLSRQRGSRIHLIALSLVYIFVSIYIVSVGGDFYGFWRFLAPYLPLLALLCSLSAVEIFRHFSTKTSAHVVSRIVTGLLIISVFLGWGKAYDPLVDESFNGSFVAYRDNAHDYFNFFKGYGEWLKDNVPADTVIAVTWLGIIPYYSQLKTIDMLGLIDHHIAHEGKVDPSAAIGHRRIDPEYVLQKAPDIYVVEFKAKFNKEKGSEIPSVMSKIEEAIIEHVPANALEKSLRLHDFRMDYVPAFGQLDTGEKFIFFKRDLELRKHLDHPNKGTKDWYYRLASLYRTRGLLQEATSSMTKAWEIEPTNPVFQLELAYLYFDMGDYDKALEIFSRPVGHKNFEGDAAYGRGLSLNKLGRTEEAVRELRTFLKLSPNSPYARNAIQLINTLTRSR